jgi:hypothetical protein
MDYLSKQLKRFNIYGSDIALMLKGLTLKHLEEPEKSEINTEAIALAKLLDCHLIITSINTKTRSINTTRASRAKHDDAPIIHLKCELDPWSYYSKTLGDNSSNLYTAMARALENYWDKNIFKNNRLSDSRNFDIKIITAPNERLELYNLLSNSSG